MKDKTKDMRNGYCEIRNCNCKYAGINGFGKFKCYYGNGCVKDKAKK